MEAQQKALCMVEKLQAELTKKEREHQVRRLLQHSTAYICIHLRPFLLE